MTKNFHLYFLCRATGLSGIVHPHRSTEVFIMNESTKEQIQQSIAAYGALLRHINH